MTALNQSEIGTQGYVLTYPSSLITGPPIARAAQAKLGLPSAGTDVKVL